MINYAAHVKRTDRFINVYFVSSNKWNIEVDKTWKSRLSTIIRCDIDADIISGDNVVINGSNWRVGNIQRESSYKLIEIGEI